MTPKRNGFIARKQRNGQTRFYSRDKISGVETPLGNEFRSAMIKHVKLRYLGEHTVFPCDEPARNVVDAYCTATNATLSKSKWAHRQVEQAHLLSYLAQIEHPSISTLTAWDRAIAKSAGIPVDCHERVIQLLRAAWEWMTRAGFLQQPSPWPALPRTHLPVLMEVASILSDYTSNDDTNHDVSVLKLMLREILHPKPDDLPLDAHVLRLQTAPFAHCSPLVRTLEETKARAREYLMANGRNDLIHELNTTSIASLQQLVCSPDRHAYVPPGRLTLEHRRLEVIAQCTQQRTHAPKQTASEVGINKKEG